MNMRHINLAALAIVGIAAIAAGLTAVINGERSEQLDPAVTALPECDLATMRDTDPPCRLIESGTTFIYWDGIKSRPVPAPTPVPLIYPTQSIHPAILATAEAEGITLSLDDYEMVYPGIVHSHFPIDCDELPFCSEMYWHRFDSQFGTYFGSPGYQSNIQRHGVNYVRVGGVYYMEDLSQLTEPTSVPATSTAVLD